jgi:hypothetical protein
VRARLRGWLLVFGVIAICAGVVWLVDQHRSRKIDSKASLLARLPEKDAVILAIDFAALRQAGLIDLLANSKTPEDEEYKQFVSKTDFDYKQDLDLALASFGPTGKYFLLKGRFDWNQLHSYVKSEGGECYNTMCRMRGSTPDRKISFFPLRPEIMAMAVSRDSEAASQLMGQPAVRTGDVQNDPVSLSFSPAGLKQAGGGFPTGTQMFVQNLENAEQIVLSIGPQGKDFQLTLTARCRSDHDAELLVAELERSTALLRSLIARENRTPNPLDLSGVLTAGAFSRAGPQVTGRWPISHNLIQDTLTGGS